ncbi:MAG: hypothetical protein EBT92_09700 [Planctomycetes bacterium]|nr:hypothetical protein [Planctomycetota bacterium]NBY02426.1 hypothetical protein [Planctomycetota bacterium]
MLKNTAPILLLSILIGCGSEGEGPKVQVKMEEVPPAALKTAQGKVPGMVFTEAFLKKDGTYELRGKTKTGKVREVEVKADGTFVDLE